MKLLGKGPLSQPRYSYLCSASWTSSLEDATEQTSQEIPRSKVDNASRGFLGHSSTVITAVLQANRCRILDQLLSVLLLPDIHITYTPSSTTPFALREEPRVTRRKRHFIAIASTITIGRRGRSNLHIKSSTMGYLLFSTCFFLLGVATRMSLVLYMP